MLTRRAPQARTYEPGWLSVFRDYDKRVGADMKAWPYQVDNLRRPDGSLRSPGQDLFANNFPSAFNSLNQSPNDRNRINQGMYAKLDDSLQDKGRRSGVSGVPGGAPPPPTTAPPTAAAAGAGQQPNLAALG